MNPPIWQTSELPRLLAEDLLVPADTGWRNHWAPELSYGRHSGPARRTTRAAAVVALLCRDGADWSLPLTVRHSGLSRHGGQVSLPGGLLDAGETPRDAAARELEEELGVQCALQWIGELAPLYVFASDAMVTPCVGVVDGWPSWKPQPAEVDHVLRLPLEQLLNAQPTTALTIQRGPFRFTAPQLMVEGHSAWGATACILGELRGRLLRISDTSR